jgi:hypothetical protein
MKSAFSILAVAIALTTAGCGVSECDGVDCGHDHGQTAHIHPTLGPHQGELIELGDEEYHAELVLDDAAESVTVYLLDAHALDAVGADAVEAKINVVHDGAAEQFPLQPSPQLFDAQGQTSRFISGDKQVHHALEHIHDPVQLVVAIGGKQYRGSIDREHQH